MFSLSTVELTVLSEVLYPKGLGYQLYSSQRDLSLLTKEHQASLFWIITNCKRDLQIKLVRIIDENQTRVLSLVVLLKEKGSN